MTSPTTSSFYWCLPSGWTARLKAEDVNAQVVCVDLRKGFVDLLPKGWTEKEVNKAAVTVKSLSEDKRIVVLKSDGTPITLSNEKVWCRLDKILASFSAGEKLPLLTSFFDPKSPDGVDANGFVYSDSGK